MHMRFVPALLLGISAAAAPAAAHAPWPSPGALVGVTVEVEGYDSPLYSAVDGSGRYYVEARPGARYSIRLDNRAQERLGVLVLVDGLNAISGEREAIPASGRPGRMYVLDPWDTAVVQGWRTSLSDVRRFTFVDERSSYAARSGKANSKMGWIEVAVYREVPWASRRPAPREDRVTPPAAREEERDAAKRRDEAEAPPATAAPAPGVMSPRMGGRSGEAGPDVRSDGAYGRPDSYPGTGWGQRAYDPATVVDFHPRAVAAERITVRYEYARALQALGILPRPGSRDRLTQRDRGDGFARPPGW
jgi:hypothetical protein